MIGTFNTSSSDIQEIVSSSLLLVDRDAILKIDGCRCNTRSSKTLFILKKKTYVLFSISIYLYNYTIS